MNNSPETIISVRNLKTGYGQDVILQNINFEVRRGEVFVILGGSGSGKSTLLKTLIGLYAPNEGEVWIDGHNLVTADDEERMTLLRKIGVLYQGGALFGSMTLLENVRLPLDELTALPEPLKELMALSRLKLVGLGDAAQKMPSELSGGMQKRAGIARAMVLDPQILFLDEPSAGLDPVTSAGLDQLILELAHHFGITFVVVTHELASIYNIADRSVMLDSHSRTIIAEGKPAKLRDHATDPWVRLFFNREPDSMHAAHPRLNVMNHATNNFKIGLFTLGGVVILIVGVLAFGARGYLKPTSMFETYITGDVTGLSVGSPVELRGVQVGKVKRIGFSWIDYQLTQPSYIVVDFEVQNDVSPMPPGETQWDPLKAAVERGLRARVKNKGITGTSILSLEYVNPSQSPPIQFPWKPRYIYIPAAPGQFMRIARFRRKIFAERGAH